MTIPRRRLAAAVLAAGAAAALLESCANPGPQAAAGAPTPTASAPLKQTYADLGRAGGRVFTLDPARSAIRIYVFRGGTAAKLGHNHVLSAPVFDGFFHLPPEGPAQGHFDLQFRLDELQIDVPEHRAGLGSAFASVLSAEAIQGTREHMLGEANLEADRYPFVRIHALQIVGEAPRFAAKVQIEIHGQLREAWVPLTVDGLPEQLAVGGSLVLRQSDFGAKPYSVLGGLLAVKDEVVIDFRLVGG